MAGDWRPYDWSCPCTAPHHCPTGCGASCIGPDPCRLYSLGPQHTGDVVGIAVVRHVCFCHLRESLEMDQHHIHGPNFVLTEE